MFGRSHRAGAHQYRPPLPVYLDDPFHHRVPFFPGRGKNPGRQGLPGEGFVGGDGNDVEPVHRPEFIGHFRGGARHPGQVEVAAEEALVADAGQGFILVGDLAAFLGFDQLVEPAAPNAGLPSPVRCTRR